MDDEKRQQALLKIAVAKQLISYQEKVKEDRRWQFEQWDKNSAALIEQYKRDIADAEADLK